jgi:hypothetical protein
MILLYWRRLSYHLYFANLVDLLEDSRCELCAYYLSTAYFFVH